MTAQGYDNILHDRYSWVLGPRPVDLWLLAHPDIAGALRQLPGKSTANYRGYSAAWAISDGGLFLTRFGSRIVKDREALESRLPLFAGWVYGRIDLLYPRNWRAGETGILASMDIDGGRVGPDRRIEVTVHHSHGFGYSVRDPCTRNPMGWCDPRSLKPWPGSAIKPQPPTFALCERYYDDDADQWGFHAALMHAGLETAPPPSEIRVLRPRLTPGPDGRLSGKM